MTNTTAIDVMKYIKSQMNVFGEVQLQKLVYYAQAWSLAWDGRPLFSDRIEAWKMGPVVPALRFRSDAADPSALSAEDRSIVDAVIQHYGKHPGQALAEMSHQEEPWANAWAKRPEGLNWCNEVITHDAMRVYYTAIAIKGGEDMPVRQPASGRVSNETVLAIASANAERWKETLAILAK